MPYRFTTRQNITFSAGTMYKSNIDPAKLADAVQLWASRYNRGVDLRVFPDGSIRGWKHPFFEKNVFAAPWVTRITELARFAGEQVHEKLTVAYGPGFIQGAVVQMNVAEAMDHARLFNSADLQLFLAGIGPVESSLEVIRTHGNWPKPYTQQVRSEKAIQVTFERPISTDKLVEAAERLGQTSFFLLHGMTVTVFDAEA